MREADYSEYPTALSRVINSMAKAWLVTGVTIAELEDGKISVAARFLGPGGAKAWGVWLDGRWSTGQIMHVGDIPRDCRAGDLKALVSPAKPDPSLQGALF